jgi:hypothetical protein
VFQQRDGHQEASKDAPHFARDCWDPVTLFEAPYSDKLPKQTTNPLRNRPRRNLFLQLPKQRSDCQPHACSAYKNSLLKIAFLVLTGTALMAVAGLKRRAAPADRCGS